MTHDDSPLVVAAPDAPTAGWMLGRLQAATGRTGVAIHPGKNWTRAALAALGTGERPLLVLIPGPKMKDAPLALADACLARGGLCLVWDEGPVDPDGWIRNQLLKNAGALLHDRLPVIECAAVVYFGLPGDGFDGVDITGGSSHLKDRIAARLPERRGSRPLQIKVKDKDVLLLCDARRLQLDAAPSDLGAAVALLQRHFAPTAPTAFQPVTPDQELVALIARPPARLLSETTSKRLLGAFGLDSPKEELCTSASGACRIQSELGHVTLKLVQPALERKQARGLVLPGLDTAAAVRRGFEFLMAEGQKNAPPSPLGVLVSAHHEAGLLFSLTRVTSTKTGDLILLYPGDRIDGHPVAAIPVDSDRLPSDADLTDAAVEAPVIVPLRQALHRFRAAARQLGDKVTRMEIHPLLVLPGRPAMMLDALVGIADHTGHTQKHPLF